MVFRKKVACPVEKRKGLVSRDTVSFLLSRSVVDGDLLARPLPLPVDAGGRESRGLAGQPGWPALHDAVSTPDVGDVRGHVDFQVTVLEKKCGKRSFFV